MHAKFVARSIAQYKVNIIIKILIISDFLVFSASQLLGPIFAIFIEDFIIGASIKTVGIAAALFLITKSITEIPVGLLIDKIKGEKDDLYFALTGTLLTGLIFILFIYIDKIWQLYALQILLGIGSAISYPGWYTIFTKHVDKGKEGFEWSLYDVLVGVGMSATAALGGFIAEAYGFQSVFITVAIITFIAGLLLFFIGGKVNKK